MLFSHPRYKRFGQWLVSQFSSGAQGEPATVESEGAGLERLRSLVSTLLPTGVRATEKSSSTPHSARGLERLRSLAQPSTRCKRPDNTPLREWRYSARPQRKSAVVESGSSRRVPTPGNGPCETKGEAAVFQDSLGHVLSVTATGDGVLIRPAEYSVPLDAGTGDAWAVLPAPSAARACSISPHPATRATVATEHT